MTTYDGCDRSFVFPEFYGTRRVADFSYAMSQPIYNCIDQNDLYLVVGGYWDVGSVSNFWPAGDIEHWQCDGTNCS